MFQKLSWQVNQWGMTSAIVCLVLYVAAYVAMLNPIEFKYGFVTASPQASRAWTREPNYRLHLPLVEKAFQPIHQLDRMIRPGYWAGADPQPGFNQTWAGSNGGGFGGGGFGGGFGGQPNCNSCRR